MKVIAALLLALPATLGAAEAGQRRAAAGPLGDSRIFIMAAEDRRMVLPVDLHTPAIDALRASLAEDAKMLVDLTRSPDPRVQAAAIRALGRYESRDFTATLLQYLTTGPTTEVASALAQSLRGEPSPLDVSGQQVQGILEALIKAGEASLSKPGPERFNGIGGIARAVGRLPYVRAEQVESADAFLLTAMRRVEDDFMARSMYMPDITRGVESLARLHSKLSFPGTDTIEWLRRIASGTLKDPPSAMVNAMAALVAARGVDEDTLRAAVTSRGEELRRLAVVSLAGAGSPITEDERTRLLSTLLSDSSLIVRVEAVRAWTRTETATNGCGRLLDTLKDRDLPVVLVAIDALGDACLDDQNVTDWLTTEVRTPPQYAWHREAHALVALAKRAPDRAAIAMTAFVPHQVWQVRLYAARAAVIMKDVFSLERLAADPNTNVREATLARLRLLKGADSDPVFVSALAQNDYHLLRTAANELKGAAPTSALVAALFDALKRVTAARKETSRDTRLALLARIGELGSADQAGLLVPLLEDFDIPVALAAAAIVEKWTGKPEEIAPQLLPRPAPPLAVELEDAKTIPARVKFSNGKIVQIGLNPDEAPLASIRFMRLAKAGYYNGLTIHRIEPNFVVQGGSPGANEYVGDGPYVRDEISLLGNTRGTMGLSTRGRDTGDAQFYFNLIDNPRLDYEYTVFGRVVGPPDRVDLILEGDTIATITFEKTSTGGSRIPSHVRAVRARVAPLRAIHR